MAEVRVDPEDAVALAAVTAGRPLLSSLAVRAWRRDREAAGEPCPPERAAAELGDLLAAAVPAGGEILAAVAAAAGRGDITEAAGQVAVAERGGRRYVLVLASRDPAVLALVLPVCEPAQDGDCAATTRPPLAAT